MTSHAKHLFISSTSCHLPSSSMYFLQATESYKLQSIENFTSSLYRKLSVALNFLLMSLALGQHSVTCTK